MDQGISIDSSTSAQEKPSARANQLLVQPIHTSLTQPCPPVALATSCPTPTWPWLPATGSGFPYHLQATPPFPPPLPPPSAAEGRVGDRAPTVHSTQRTEVLVGC